MQCGEDADGQMHAGVGISERCGADRRRAIPESGGGGGTARALGDVLVDLQVLVVMPLAKTLHGGDDHAGIELVDAPPREAHAVERAGTEILHQNVRFLDQLLENLFALRRLGVERQRALVAVEHGEIQGVLALDVTKLGARDVAGARALDLDHVGAEPGEQLRAGRSGLHVREINDLDAFKRLAHSTTPCCVLVTTLAAPATTMPSR